jgi:trehalose-6-phosphate synthase
MWPLFHYHPGEITFDESAWEAYTEANRLFAKAVAKDVQDNDMVWVHDYHLLPAHSLPQLRDLPNLACPKRDPAWCPAL